MAIQTPARDAPDSESLGSSSASSSPAPADGRRSGGLRRAAARAGARVGAAVNASVSGIVGGAGAGLGLASGSAKRDAQLQIFPQRFRLMCVLGVILVCLFLVVDLMYPWPPEVVLTPRQFFGIRALWVAAYLVLLATSWYREELLWLQIARDFTLTAVTASCLGALCAHTGRMASPYYGGLLILMLARFVMIPGGLLRVAPLSLFMLAVFILFTCLWPSPNYPRPGIYGWKGITTLAFILGPMVPGILGTVATDRLAMGLETAKMMGRYRLVRQLGRGGMGEVHLAYHASLRRPCAVKILKEELCDPVATARFEREAEAASRLRHPNTIAVFDFGRTDAGQPYYVMEYLEGSELSALVRKEGPLVPERGVFILEQAAGSLGEAHALGMIHRDVKPGNLFITAMGGRGDFVKVLDFGLVKGVDLGPELTRQDAFMGTPRYMAPEALSGQKVDCRVDVYALGAVGYFMLCGEPPFSSGDAYLDIYRQINDPPPPIESRRPAGLPKPSEALVALIMRCLEKDKNRRFASATEVLRALEQTPEHGQWLPKAAPSSMPLRPPPGPPSPVSTSRPNITPTPHASTELDPRTGAASATPSAPTASDPSPARSAISAASAAPPARSGASAPAPASAASVPASAVSAGPQRAALTHTAPAPETALAAVERDTDDPTERAGDHGPGSSASPLPSDPTG